MCCCFSYKQIFNAHAQVDGLMQWSNACNRCSQNTDAQTYAEDFHGFVDGDLPLIADVNIQDT